jgi:hypothetical protein
MPQSVYQVPPGGVATVNAARLLMSPGLGCGNCRPGPHCQRCRQRKMSGYSRVNPIYKMGGLGQSDGSIPTWALIAGGIVLAAAVLFTPKRRKGKILYRSGIYDRHGEVVIREKRR